MKNILKLEELALFILCLYALYSLNIDWWYYLLLFIGPDISMVGYAGGNLAGAATYNLFHHKGLAVVVFIAGLVLPNLTLEITGLILFGHSSMDRVLGYGLKLNKGFKYTHLGKIGKQ